MYLLTILIFSPVKCLFKSFAYFPVVFLLVYKNSLYSLNIVSDMYHIYFLQLYNCSLHIARDKDSLSFPPHRVTPPTPASFIYNLSLPQPSATPLAIYPYMCRFVAGLFVLFYLSVCFYTNTKLSYLLLLNYIFFFFSNLVYWMTPPK